MSQKAMWSETNRFRVIDESGLIYILVEMCRKADLGLLVGNHRAMPSCKFLFLLDGSDVIAEADGTFINAETGKGLKRVMDG